MEMILISFVFQKETTTVITLSQALQAFQRQKDETVSFWESH